VRDVVDKYRNKRIEKISAPTHPVEESESANA